MLSIYEIFGNIFKNNNEVSFDDFNKDIKIMVDKQKKIINDIVKTVYDNNIDNSKSYIVHDNAVINSNYKSNLFTDHFLITLKHNNKLFITQNENDNDINKLDHNKIKENLKKLNNKEYNRIYNQVMNDFGSNNKNTNEIEIHDKLIKLGFIKDEDYSTRYNPRREIPYIYNKNIYTKYLNGYIHLFNNDHIMTDFRILRTIGTISKYTINFPSFFNSKKEAENYILNKISKPLFPNFKYEKIDNIDDEIESM